MGKKLELMRDIGKNTPTALYELASGLSIAGGALALPVAGVIYLSGDFETAKQVALAGGLVACVGLVGGIVRCIPEFFVGDMPETEYKSDLSKQQSFALERIAESIFEYKQEKNRILKW